jgi:hypothetical protein
MEKQNQIPHNDVEFYLIGFRLNPDNESPELYTLIISEDDDYKPLLASGCILFFSKPELAADALKSSQQKNTKIYNVPKNIELVVDVAETLYLLESEDIDLTATILNCLNTLDDLIKAIKLTVPEHYKNILYKLADHLTFNQEYSSFFSKQNISRSSAIDEILWCLGTITIKSKILG